MIAFKREPTNFKSGEGVTVQRTMEGKYVITVWKDLPNKIMESQVILTKDEYTFVRENEC